MRCFSLLHAVMAGAALLFAAEAQAEEAPRAPTPAPVGSTMFTPQSAAPAKAAPRARRKAKPAAPAVAPGTPIATYPSFRLLDDGSSRVTVEITRKVAVTEHKARGRVVYSLAGAAVPGSNSRLALPTSVFHTPVDRVEVVAQGDGADLIIELREAVEPTFRVFDTPRGSSVLQVDFARPAGDAPAPGIAPAKRSTETRRIEQNVPADD